MVYIYCLESIILLFEYPTRFPLKITDKTILARLPDRTPMNGDKYERSGIASREMRWTHWIHKRTGVRKDDPHIGRNIAHVPINSICYCVSDISVPLKLSRSFHTWTQALYRKEKQATLTATLQGWRSSLASVRPVTKTRGKQRKKWPQSIQPEAFCLFFSDYSILCGLLFVSFVVFFLEMDSSQVFWLVLIHLVQ